MPTSSVISNHNTSTTKRKSWFSIRRQSPKTKQEKTSAPPSAFNQDILSTSPPQDHDRLRPIQFSPNRIATLYVTPSERNLYLAAMAQLDEPPRPLPLWADPAPNIPTLPLSPPIEINETFPDGPHPLTTAPISPKLVTTPGLPFPGVGLQIRDEFRNGNTRPRSTKHALLSLVPASFMRFTCFPAEVLIAVNEAISENWRPGIWLQSEHTETLERKRRHAGEIPSYRIELHGDAWKKKGSQELDSIRLVLAIFTAMGVHGWTAVDTIQASGLKKDSHNILFAYSPEKQAIPPAFFAVSLPLPDRISVISPPSKVTPAILSAVRSAIVSNSHLTNHSRAGTANTEVTVTSKDSKRVTWGNGAKGDGIKLEGWVHQGVYRFWVGGMRRWLGGRVKQKKVDNLHPQLLVDVINNLSSLHFSLAGSIPMFPLAKGRDVLYFASLPQSGFSYLDAYKPDHAVTAHSEPESPVFISPTSSLPPGQPSHAPPLPGRKNQNSTDNDPRYPESGQRILPWTTVIEKGEHSVDTRIASPTGRSSVLPPPSAMPADFHGRTVSHDSSRPLIPSGSNQSSPKPRNVLLKKNSIRRQRSISADGSVDMPVMNAQAPLGDDDMWSMIDVPTHVGHLGVRQYREEPIGAEPEGRVRRLSNDSQSEKSVYQDTEEVFPNPVQIPLGQPLNSFHHELSNQLDLRYHPELSAGTPLKETGGARRAGSALVDVGSGLGIPSMHGSVGYLGAPSFISGVEGRDSHLSVPADRQSGLSTPNRDTTLTPNGSRLRNEFSGDIALSVPPPVPPKPEGWLPDEVDGSSSASVRAGSARTRLSIVGGKGKGKSTY